MPTTPPGRVLTAINQKGGVGKCLTGDAVVFDAVTGQPLTLERAVADPTFRFVASWDADASRVCVKPVAAQIDSGVKPTLRLTTASGRTVTVTPHHPMLLPDGWRRAEDISVGETIALAARLPAPLMPVPMAEPVIDLLAILLAEGSTSTPKTGFSTTDPHVLNLATRGAEEIGARVKLNAVTATIDYVLVGAPPATRGHGSCSCGCGFATTLAHSRGHRFVGYTNGEPLKFLPGHGGTAYSTLAQFRREHGLHGCLAKHKRMPAAVWSLPTEQVARFVSVFIMCDGTVGSDGRVTITLASEGLVRDFQMLLLRLGVQSIVAERAVKCDGKAFQAWDLRIVAASLPTFAQQASLWGSKHDRLMARVALMRHGASNPNVGNPSLPAALRTSMQSKVRAGHPGGVRVPRRPTLQGVARRLGWNLPTAQFVTLMGNHRTNGQYHLSRKALRAFIDEFEAMELEWLLSEDLFWDPIVSIEAAGEQQVYDLTVERTHSFIANGMVVHNTSVIANLAVTLASRGFRVLAVDLDPQGNLGLDLGFKPDPDGNFPGHPLWDDGLSLANALITGTAPTVLDGVRRYDNNGHIDVIAAGGEIKTVPVVLAAQAAFAQRPYQAKLAELLHPLADAYDLLLIDCPPSDMVLRGLALGAARYALAPTRSDVASWRDGLDSLVTEIAVAREHNPQLRVLGAALFATTNAPALQRDTRAGIASAAQRWFVDDPFGIPPVFTTSIRSAEAVAARTRREGKTAAEIAAAQAGGPSPLELLQRKRNGEDVSGIKLAPRGTGNVADDYERLAAEVLDAIWRAEQSQLDQPLTSAGAQ